MRTEIEETRKETLESFGLFVSNAAARLNDLSYSRFMHGLKLANIELVRKILADMAMNEPENFKKLAEVSTKALNK